MREWLKRDCQTLADKARKTAKSLVWRGKPIHRGSLVRIGLNCPTYKETRMDLTVEWISATRTGEEKVAVEQAYRNRLLDLFGSVAAAAEAKGHYHRSYEPPVHHWTKFNKIAFIEATTPLTPCERHLAHFVVKFEKHD